MIDVNPRACANAVAALSLFVGSVASAQGNDRSLPVGGRSTLMGSTGVALARDGSAPFINPATIVAIGNNRLAFSVSFFDYSYTRYGGWNHPGPIDQGTFGPLSLSDTSGFQNRFHGLPSTLCLFFTVKGLLGADDTSAAEYALKGRQKLAFCLANLESNSVDLTALSFRATAPGGSTQLVESIAQNWNRFYIGPTFGLAITDEFDVALSLHGVVTTESFALDAASITSVVNAASGAQAIQTSLGIAGAGDSVDAVATIGATYRIGIVTLGASAQIPSLHLFGNMDATEHDSFGGAQGTATIASGNGNLSAGPPPRFAVGVGVQWPRLTVEVDEAIALGASAAIQSSMDVTTTRVVNGVSTTTPSAPTFTVPMHATANTSIGAEYFLSPTFSLLGGASTSFTSLSSLSPDPTVGNLVQTRANHVALAFGIGSYGGVGDILMGTQLDYGWGNSLVANPYTIPNTWSVLGTHTYGALFVLSGTTSLRAIEHAIVRVTNVVTGRPEEAPEIPPHPSGAPLALPPQPPPPAPPAPKP